MTGKTYSEINSAQRSRFKNRVASHKLARSVAGPIECGGRGGMFKVALPVVGNPLSTRP